MKEGTITFGFMLLFLVAAIGWYWERQRAQTALHDAGTYETKWRQAEQLIDSLEAEDKTVINNITKVNHYHDERQNIIATILDSLLADSIRAALQRATYPSRGQADAVATE